MTMKNKVLEVGAGNNPAAYFPGRDLKDADYFAMDICHEELADGIERAGNEGLLEVNAGVAAEFAALPFADESLDTVILKSVFGEYTMDPGYTGSSIWNTRLGLYESFRVLKPGGEIVIAEENTPYGPADMYNMASDLYYSGFGKAIFYPIQNYTNPAWLQQRSRFWDIEPIPDDFEPGDTLTMGRGRAIDARMGYLLTATKEHGPTEKFKSELSLRGIWKANRERGWDHPDNEESAAEMTFTRLKREHQELFSSDIGYMPLENAVVISRDKVTTLKDDLLGQE